MVYLDHAATTPMLPEAVQAMTAQFAVTGNASSLHAAGRRARRTVEESRESLAASLGARPSEVVLTSGGTEADNLAVKGLYWSRRDADPARTRVLASPVEHHAVLDAVDWLAEHEAARVEWLPVDAYGRVHPDALREAIARDPSDVALATVMWANNEIGTIMPVPELVAVAAEFDIPLHADAVQAFGQLDLDFAASGLAAMTVSGHKIGGPYGIGALLLGREWTPTPLLHGGGQERQVRSGTLDTPAVAAFAVAAAHAAAHREEFAREIGALRDALISAVQAAVPDAILGGDPDPAGRLAANAHFSFPGCEGDSLLLLLDARGIECSTGSACTAGVAQPSHVVLATGTDPDLARGTLRFSLGHTSTKADVEAVADAIGPVVERARGAGLS
ncbi:cysteine desulfurase family protein [Streptomyces sp. ME19-01-6]|uniref:cysteine desulfurase family protein n=1 Tax=Streptomyces sp. ME19-01-6 TaxID=3028686 RepID=UPI0029BEF167|nr:cysteine desulfurase family protein [Streptomyces sp. ME19-01-6]MDX3231033.1 cysteine desulfurase family protein [Streptomyces sp. ME19-01-6]